MKKTNILFVHPLIGNAYELYKAFDRNEKINIIPLIEKDTVPTSSFISKIRHKLKIPIDSYGINKKLEVSDLSCINILFIVKGNEIYPSVLKKIISKYPKLKLVNWTLDDMYAWHNRSIFYTLSLKYYNLVVTTKSYNLDELPKLGAIKMLFANQAYSKEIHNPKECTNKYVHDVVFIGYPEEDRIKSIEYLTNNSIRVDIYGYPNAWKKTQHNIDNDNIMIHHESLYGSEYAEALSCAKISLCFLRKANRDLHTSRSIEIPACGGFMIAERTSEHLELFKEDEEAVYFDSDEELLEKVRYYLEHESERKMIAENGYKGCLASGYSYDDMVEKIINKVSEI